MNQQIKKHVFGVMSWIRVYKLEIYTGFCIELTEGSKEQDGQDSWLIVRDGDDGHCFRRLACLNPPQTSTMVLYTLGTV